MGGAELCGQTWQQAKGTESESLSLTPTPPGRMKAPPGFADLAMLLLPDNHTGTN